MIGKHKPELVLQIRQQMHAMVDLLCDEVLSLESERWVSVVRSYRKSDDPQDGYSLVVGVEPPTDASALY